MISYSASSTLCLLCVSHKLKETLKHQWHKCSLCSDDILGRLSIGPAEPNHVPVSVSDDSICSKAITTYIDYNSPAKHPWLTFSDTARHLGEEQTLVRVESCAFLLENLFLTCFLFSSLCTFSSNALACVLFSFLWGKKSLLFFPDM